MSKPNLGVQVISINGRKTLDKIQEEFPKLEIIIGKANDDDKSVSLDLAEMEYTRANIFDAATKTILGERVDKLEKPVKLPKVIYIIIGFLFGAAATFYFYNFMGGLKFITG